MIHKRNPEELGKEFIALYKGLAYKSKLWTEDWGISPGYYYSLDDETYFYFDGCKILPLEESPLNHLFIAPLPEQWDDYNK